MQLFVREGKWNMKKKSQKIDLNSYFFSNVAAETEKKRLRIVEVFYKKIAFFPLIIYKKKLFSLSFGKK